MRISKSPQLRKEEIIKIAEKLFLEQGIEKTSIAQIASAVGVAKGLVYYYFKTKEDVLDGVVSDIASQQANHLKNRLSIGEPDIFEKLIILIDAYYNIYSFSNGAHSSVFQLETHLLTLVHKKFVYECQEIYSNLISEGNELGYFRGDYPEEKLLMTLEGVFSLANLRRIDKELLLLLVEQALELPKDSLVQLSGRLLSD